MARQGDDVVFFFNDTATTEIYTLFPTRRSSDLRGAAPLNGFDARHEDGAARDIRDPSEDRDCEHKVGDWARDRKSTRLNSSHANISYAVFCLKKQTKKYDWFTLSLHTCASFGMA